MALETEVRQFYLVHLRGERERARPRDARRAAVPPCPFAAATRPSAAARRRAAAGRRLHAKRVEILSDVQKELNVEAQDVAAPRTQTWARSSRR